MKSIFKKAIIAKLCMTYMIVSLSALQLAPSRSEASSAHGDTGLGIVLGDPSGITLKHWMNNRSAFDLGLAYAFNNFVLFYGDYLYHFNLSGGRGSASRFISELRPYIGIGGILLASTSSTRTQKAFFVDTSGSSSSIGLGLRIPLGMEWLPHGAPLGVFLELAPGIGIIPGTFGMLNAGIGVRFYF